MGTTPEIDVVLAKPLHAVVGLNRPGRPPQLSVVWFEWDGTTFRFSTLGSRAKYRRFTSDPHLSILVDDPETLRYVVAHGVAHEEGRVTRICHGGSSRATYRAKTQVTGRSTWTASCSH